MRELAALLTDRLDSLLVALGLTNPTQRMRCELRFHRRGSLSIVTDGQKRGEWFDHEAGTGGGPLELIQHQLGYNSIREAGSWARSWLGLPANEAPLPTSCHELKSIHKTEKDEQIEKIAKAREIYDHAEDIEGTIAESYFRKRGITAQIPCSFRFTVISRFLEGNAIGAIFVPATNDDDEVQAVQRIYIRDGRKANVPLLPNAKRTNGVSQGAAVRLPGDAAQPLILAEGPETALSVWQVSGYETWAALGSIAKLCPPAGRALIVAADGDHPNQPAAQALKQALKRFNDAGHNVRVARPTAGLDWNDVLVRDGEAAVAIGIANAQPYPARHRPHWDPPERNREAVLTGQHEAIVGFFARAGAFVAANIHVSEQRHAELEARDLATDRHWGDSFEKRASAARKAAVTRQVKARTRDSYGIADLDNGERLLISGAQGTGKTATTLIELAKLPRGIDAWILQPTLAKALEVADEYESVAGETSLPIVVVRGRSAADPDRPGERMCPRYKTAKRAAEAGFDVQHSLCEDKRGRRCAFFDLCGYQAQKRRIGATDGAIFAMSHNYAFIPSPARKPAIVVSDESILKHAVKDTEFHPDQIKRSAEVGHLGINTFGDAAEYIATATRVYEAVTLHQGQELSTLRDAGLDASAFKEAEQYLRNLMFKEVAQLEPPLNDGEVNSRLDKIDRSDLHNLIALYRSIGREWDTGRMALTAVVYHADAPVVVNGIFERQARVKVHSLRRVTIPDSVPTLLLDGTGDLELNRKIWGAQLKEQRFAVDRNATVVQVHGKTFSRHSLTGDKGRFAWQPTAQDKKSDGTKKLRQQVTKFVQALPGNVFAAATKKVEEAVLAPLPVKTGHFSALRGINAFEECDTAVVIGREQVAPRSLEEMTRAFAADDPEPLLTLEPDAEGRCVYRKQSRARRMRDGTVKWQEVEVHPDLRCQRMLEQIREAEILQAIDRVRPIFNRRRIYVLTSVVLDLTVDHAPTWPVLSQGGNRFEQLWDRFGIVFLSPILLHRVSPDLFPSEKAAGRALERASHIPPTALIEDPIRRAEGISVASFRRAGQKGPKPSRVLFDPSRLSSPQQMVSELLGEVIATWSVDGQVNASA